MGRVKACTLPPVTTAVVCSSHHFSDAGMLLEALALRAGQESPRKAKQVALLTRSTPLLSLPECKPAAAEEDLRKALHMDRRIMSLT